MSTANFNLFGTPSATEPWGWNFYGHHVCINCRLIGGRMVATPVFLGAEPNGIDAGPWAGLCVFDDEESLGLALMRSLPDELQQRAQLYRHKRDASMPAGRMLARGPLNYLYLSSPGISWATTACMIIIFQRPWPHRIQAE